MDQLWPLIVLFAVVILVTACLKRRLPATTAERLPYCRKDYLLTKAERAFFEVLRDAVQNEYHIAIKPRLADLFYVRKGTGQWQSHFNRIQSKHIDFVLCRHVDMKPLLAVELDDSSHDRQDRQDRRDRDDFVNEVFRQSGFPLLRIPAKRGYSQTELRRSVQQELQSSGAV